MSVKSGENLVVSKLSETNRHVTSTAGGLSPISGLEMMEMSKIASRDKGDEGDEGDVMDTGMRAGSSRWRDVTPQRTGPKERNVPHRGTNGALSRILVTW